MSNLSLDKIPIDIVRLVINSLDTITDKATLQDLRLTCRLLNDLATPQLFHTLTFRAQHEMQIRQKIAPRYLHHVRWLFVDCWTYIQSLLAGLTLRRPSCPFRFLDLLAQMPQLEQLWLRGTYLCDGEDIGVPDGDSFDGEQKALEMAALFMEMSCLTPPRQRLQTNLRFCESPVSAIYCSVLCAHLRRYLLTR